MRFCRQLALVVLIMPLLALVFSLMVLSISALVEWLSEPDYQRHNLSLFASSATFTGCTPYEEGNYRGLGAWLRLKCSEGDAEGPLDGVAGNAAAITREIQNFLTFHGGTLSCEQPPSGVLRCEAGQVSLGAHLARHGFSPEQAIGAIQAWIATLLGFCGAIVAFVSNREMTRKEVKKNLRQFLGNVESQRIQVTNALQQVCLLSNEKAPDKDIEEAKTHLDERIIAAIEVVINTGEIPLDSSTQNSFMSSLEVAKDAPDGDFTEMVKNIQKAFGKIVKEINESD